MVTATVVLTVAIDLKRSGTYRSGFVRTLSRFFAASLANRHSSVCGCRLQCSYVQVCGRVTRQVDLPYCYSYHVWVRYHSGEHG